MSDYLSDCPEHIWALTGSTLGTDGTHHEYVCDRCGAMSFEGPDTVAGKSD